MCPPLPERGEMRWRDPARIAHNHTATQRPPPEVVVDLGHGADIHGMARKAPVPYGQALACDRPPHDTWRGITTAVLRQAPLARHLIRLGTRHSAAFHQILVTDAWVRLIDGTVQRRGRVEDELHRQGEQRREAASEGWLDGVLVGFEPLQGPVEMVQGERLRAVEAHLFSPPRRVTVERGPGRTGPVGHHGNERPCDGTVDVTEGEWWRDDLGEAQSMPDGLKDLQRPTGPGRNHAPRRRLRHALFGGPAREEAAGPLAQAFGGVGIIRPPTMVDHADCGAFVAGLPPALVLLTVVYSPKTLVENSPRCRV
jgi:hypothetical protein